MKQIAHPTLTREELERQQRSLFLWLVWAIMLLIRLGTNAHRSKRLKRLITRSERFVHAHLICVAFSRMRFAKHKRPSNIAPGVRAHRVKLRLLGRSLSVRHKSFYQRILHALHMFAHPERFVARLTRKLRGAKLHLVLATPSVVAIQSAAPRAVACADSS